MATQKEPKQKKETPGEILVAQTSAVVTVDGVRHQIKRGTTLARVGHPILRGREHMFGPLNVTFDVPISARGR